MGKPDQEVIPELISMITGWAMSLKSILASFQMMAS